jgi:hypothetical protein
LLLLNPPRKQQAASRD